MNVLAEVSKMIKIPEKELINKGMLAFLEKEIRLSEMDLADIRDKYDVTTKDELYERIESKTIKSHPAWEDYITWKNKEQYIADLKEKLKVIR